MALPSWVASHAPASSLCTKPMLAKSSRLESRRVCTDAVSSVWPSRVLRTKSSIESLPVASRIVMVSSSALWLVSLPSGDVFRD